MKIIRILFFVLALYGCLETPGPKQQISTKIDIPEYPLSESQEPLNLINGQKRLFKGSMVIFNPYASSEQIANIMMASENIRTVAAKYKKFMIGEKFKPTFDQVDPILEKYKKDLLQLKIAKPKISYDQLKREAVEWGETNSDLLDEISGGKWKQYCEAKIWEFALNKNFMTRKYLKRPTPLALCESVYQINNYFSQISCDDSLNERSYFSCLWSAVFKTHWFQKGRYKNQLQDFNSLIDPDHIEEFRNILIGGKESDQIFIDPPSDRIKMRINTIKNKIGIKILKQELGLGKASEDDEKNKKKISLCQELFINKNISKICYLFSISDEDNKSPLDQIKDIEKSNQTDEVSLNHLIYFYGSRADFDHDSRSDRYFHQGKIAKWIVFQNHRYDPKTLDTIKSRLGNLLCDFDLSSEVRAMIARKEDQIQDREKKRKIFLQLKNQSNLARLRALQAANAIEVTEMRDIYAADMAVPVSVTLKYAGNILYAKIRFWEADYIVGCFDMIRNVSLQDQSCLEMIADEEKEAVAESNAYYPGQLDYDPQSQSLFFVIKLTDPHGMGLGYVLRHPQGRSPFNDFGGRYLVDGILKIELFPNRLDESLEILTGAVTIDADREVLEGGISLIH